MSQRQAFEIFARDDSKTEGGALLPAKPARVLRFLTELYVVDGYAYKSLANATARFVLGAKRLKSYEQP